MNTQDKTSLSLKQEVTGAVTTANALKMAITMLEGIEVVFLRDLSENNPLKINSIEALNACKEALDLSEKQYTFPDKLNIVNCDLKQPSQGIELEWYNKGWTDANWEWQGLTADEIFDLRDDDYGVPSKYWDDYARAIEQELKDKNT